MAFGLGDVKGGRNTNTPAKHTLNLAPLSVHSMELSPVFSFHRMAAFELTCITPITAFGIYGGGE